MSEMQRLRQEENDERIMHVEKQNSILEQSIHTLKMDLKDVEKKDDYIQELQAQEANLKEQLDSLKHLIETK